MSTRLYQLRFDPTIEDQWRLGDPVDPSGEPFDNHLFVEGGPLDVAGELFIPVDKAGRPLDVTLRTYEFVVTERIGSLLGQLAPNDLQRIPARVDSMEERYEVLNVLPRIDCIDRERTQAYVYLDKEQRTKTGTLASLAPLIERDPDTNLYRHVLNDNMRLKTAGIEGSRIFRVLGWDLWPVVTEDIKAALEEQGATGLDYRLVS